MNELMKRLSANAVSRFRFAGKSRSAARSDFDKYAIVVRRPWSEDIPPRQTLQYWESTSRDGFAAVGTSLVLR
jgi:hypothetical protein